MNSMVLSLSALASLLPAALLPFVRQAARADAVFWLLLGAALAGTSALSIVSLGAQWQTGLATALWLAVAATLGLFGLLVMVSREAVRLAPLLLPYLLVLGILATAFGMVSGAAPLTGRPDGWLIAHITVSVTTYALCTLAAVASSGVFVQERALKRRAPNAFTRMLPSVADSERLEVRLLAAGEVILGLGIATGISELYVTSGAFLTFNHKTLFSILAFLVIGGLLLLHYRSGLRGRRAARLVLVGYLLLTLAYLGVKFVSDILLA
ncbi:cytochrome c biogenesis protein CcsA [Pelagibius sp. CAU 1746]|uniref:cytochrome C assembly family protein n=1 Tax=Pelagibius sp. CAU 1746 TaxID=3140370 RepID=UPI00325BD86A